MKQYFTRFFTYCKKIWPCKKVLLVIEKAKNLTRKKHQPNQKNLHSNYPKRPKVPNNNRLNSNDHSNSQRGRSDSPYVADRNRGRGNCCSGPLRFRARPDKVDSLHDALQSCNPISYSNLHIKKVRNQMMKLFTHLEMVFLANFFH